MSELKPCPMRAENGNCSPVGGFCTSVPELYCEAANRAYQTGYHDGATEAMRRAQPDNEPLTLDELRGMDNEPVWIEHITMQKYSHWYIWSNAPVDDTHDGFDGYGKTWIAYRRPPEMFISVDLASGHDFTAYGRPSERIENE